MQQLTNENGTWRVQNLVDFEITGLQKMLEFVSLRPETQADTTLIVRKHYSAGLHLEPQTEGNSASRGGGKLLHDL